MNYYLKYKILYLFLISMFLELMLGGFILSSLIILIAALINTNLAIKITIKPKIKNLKTIKEKYKQLLKDNYFSSIDLFLIKLYLRILAFFK